VRVRLRTIGLNYAEVLSRKGLYGWAPPLPYVLGMEGFGEIEAVGPGVEASRVGEVFRKSQRLLAPFGRIVCAGFASLSLQRWNPLSWWRTWRDLPRADIRGLSVGSQGLLASHVGHLLTQPRVLLAAWEALRAFTLAHGIRPVVGARFPLDEIARAHALMESRASHGKIVLGV